MGKSVHTGHALVLAPSGRDGQVAAALLGEIDVPSKEVRSVPELVDGLGSGVLFAVLTEESLRGANLRPLVDWLGSQQPWSDLPLVILTHHGGGPERNPAAARLSETLGNVSFLERPFHPTTFVSVTRTALKGRRRQYESRSVLAALQESEERLRTALVAGRLGSWELDLATMALRSSDACKAVFGREPEQSLTYEELLASIHPDDLDRMQASVRHTVETGEDYQIEYRTIWPDGSPHWAEIRARLVKGQGSPRMVGVSSDVTSRRASEDQLRLQNETLEARVAERTAALEAAHRSAMEQEHRLRQLQKMEMIGQLTGGIAHDFNNLLMAVLGNLDLLRKHCSGDGKAMRLIDGATMGAQRGASLTQRLLAFARRQDLNVAPTDLVDLVRGMTPLIERTIGSAVEVRFDLARTPACCAIDANQVELALLNLTVNARDAMPQGGFMTVSVSLVRNDGVDQVRLAVVDTGIGMDAETLERATEPFFSTKGVGKGTGLGLSMVHGLAEQLGGTFRLSSSVGGGTSAELRFPAVEDSDAEPAAPATVSPQSPARSRLRILFVDDDALISMSSVDLLEDLGHEVIEAHSGEAALRHLAADGAINLLITDYSMPRMNGAQLAKAARDLRPDLPIILATGYAELPPGSEAGLPRLGKPYDQRQLAAQIEAVLIG